MGYFFFGFLLALINFPITVGNGTVDILPSFVGYLLLLLGCRAIGHECERFKRVKIAAIVLGVFSLAQFFLDALSLWPAEIPEIVRTVISIAVTLMALYISYEFTESMKIVERSFSKPLGVSQLATAWTLLCIGTVLYSFGAFLEDLILLCFILHILAVAWFLTSLYGVWKNFKTNKR